MYSPLPSLMLTYHTTDGSTHGYTTCGIPAHGVIPQMQSGYHVGGSVHGLCSISRMLPQYTLTHAQHGITQQIHRVVHHPVDTCSWGGTPDQGGYHVVTCCAASHGCSHSTRSRMLNMVLHNIYTEIVPMVCVPPNMGFMSRYT